MIGNFEVMWWNVRGLNAPARCLMVRETIAMTTCHIARNETTKHRRGSSCLLGGHGLNKFAYKPALGTKGGILILWDNGVINIEDVQIGQFSISATTVVKHNTSSFQLTTVYGPSRRVAKPTFLRHLRAMRPADDTRWLILGISTSFTGREIRIIEILIGD